MPPWPQLAQPSKHPLIATCRDERSLCDVRHPFSTNRQDGILIEGVVDLAFQEVDP